MGAAIIIFLAIFMLLVLFLINFYRDPKRKIPQGNSIVAPADGRIISIIDTSSPGIQIKKGFFGKIITLTREIAPQCIVVSIFMSPLDVHINRSPIEGKVKSIKYVKGKFFKAYDLEKSLMNEKNEIIIQNKKLKVKVIQIAGFLARRIKCCIKANQKVNKGGRIGMIALSSQTTLVLPKWVELKARLNQKVKAGESIIAIFDEKLRNKNS